MRRFVCAVLAFVLCASLAVPAFAAFTPSVTVKETPVVENVVDEKGKEIKSEKGKGAVATIVVVEEGKEEEVLTHIFEDSLIITSVSEAMKGDVDAEHKSDKKLTEFVKELMTELKELFQDLESGKVVIPFADMGLKAEKMVIRDLFHMNWHIGEEHAFDGEHYSEVMADEEHQLKMTLNLGVKKTDKVYIMVYVEDENGEMVWYKMKTENNGDGTVTVWFDHVGHVAVCIEQ